MGSAYLAPSFCTVLALIQGPEVAYPGGTGGPMSTLPSPQSKTAAAPASRRSRVKRVPDRGHYDAATIHAILDAAWLCHVGFIQDGQPVVIPTACWRDGEHLYIHRSTKSRMAIADRKSVLERNGGSGGVNMGD